jgi:hypothetical protein
LQPEAAFFAAPWRPRCTEDGMNNKATIDSADPMVHAANMQQMLQDLITHARRDLEQVDEPRFQALLETSAEVLKGLQTAFADYREGTETAWRR